MKEIKEETKKKQKKKTQKSRRKKKFNTKKENMIIKSISKYFNKNKAKNRPSKKQKVIIDKQEKK